MNFIQRQLQRHIPAVAGKIFIQFGAGLIEWVTKEVSAGRLRNHANGDFRDDSTGKHYSYAEIVEMYYDYLNDLDLEAVL